MHRDVPPAWPVDNLSTGNNTGKRSQQRATEGIGCKLAAEITYVNISAVKIAHRPNCEEMNGMGIGHRGSPRCRRRTSGMPGKLKLSYLVGLVEGAVHEGGGAGRASTGAAGVGQVDASLLSGIQNVGVSRALNDLAAGGGLKGDLEGLDGDGASARDAAGTADRCLANAGTSERSTNSESHFKSLGLYEEKYL